MIKIIHYFDKLEDKVRGRLSHWPIVYALIGGVGIVLFWRGVWNTADYFMSFLTNQQIFDPANASALLWWDGPLTIAAGLFILLLTGVLVPSFIGSEIIISGIKREKKLTEKTEQEIRMETDEIKEIQNDVKQIMKKINNLEEKLSSK